MIIEREPALEITQTSPFKRQAFRIASSPEAFRILSKGVYSDAITAVLRELGTNAVDGHKFATIGIKNDDGSWLVAPIPGRDKEPFDVYLPTRLDPVFRVKDRGCGLSESQIFDIYTTYFESNKRDSNDFNGALGIGSKSPFAIVSSFMVTSVFNGTKSIYSAIINEDGCPDVVKMATGPTDEENGVEVKMSVESDDINNFKDRARTVYSVFEVTPNVYSGKNKLEISRQEYMHQTEDFGTIPASWNDRFIKAIQANVAYTLDLTPLRGKISDERLSILENKAYSLHLFFENGSVNFVASREYLEYTAKTIKAIDDVITKMIALVEAEFDEICGRADTLIEAAYVIKNLALSGVGSRINPTALKVYSNDRLNTDGYILWRGTPIDKDMFFGITHTESEVFTTKEVTVNNGIAIPKARTASVCTVFDSGGTKQVNSIGIEQTPLVRTGSKYRRTTTFTLPLGSTAFILNDLKLPQYKLVEYIQKNVSSRNVYVFHPDNADIMIRMMATTTVPTYIKTSKVDIGDIERAQLVKTCRVFKNGAIQDKLLATINERGYYIVAKGSAYTFSMFDAQFDHKQTQALFKDMYTNEIINKDEEVLIIPASSLERVLEAYPKLQPIKAALAMTDWTKFPNKTRIAMLRDFIVTSGSDTTPAVKMMTHLAEVTPLTKDTSLASFITAAKQAVDTVAKSVMQMDEYEYRYNTIDKAFAKLINARIKTDAAFLKDSTDIKKFVEITNQVKTILPIMNTLYVDRISKDALTRYVESDWVANQSKI